MRDIIRELYLLHIQLILDDFPIELRQSGSAFTNIRPIG